MPDPDLEARLLKLEEANAALLAEIATLRRARVPEPEPLFRTLPGQIGEFDRVGNPRVQTGSAANVDPVQCTVHNGPRWITPLENGQWRDPFGQLRDGQGMLVSSAITKYEMSATEREYQRIQARYFPRTGDPDPE